MKQSIFLVLTMLLFPSFLCQAQNNNENPFSLDFSYTLTGLLNQGWGIGLNYETFFFDCLTVKGNLGHMTFLTGIKDVYSATVSVSLFTNYYPLSNSLDKLYFGIGSGCDFMNYFGKGELPPTTKDTLIHITPQLGWKFHVLPFLMIDVSTGYKFMVFNTQNYTGAKDYFSPGLRFDIGLKILLKKLKEVIANDQAN